jgi:ethanolamine ammonia-lyase large subunit
METHNGRPDFATTERNRENLIAEVISAITHFCKKKTCIAGSQKIFVYKKKFRFSVSKNNWLG